MRLSTASIRLVQKMNRQRKDGTYPIYIVVCFHGRVEQATGIACKSAHWDLRRECVKGDSNAPVLNKMLSELKQRVIERKNEYEYQKKKYTARMLLEGCGLDFEASDSFGVVAERLVEERRLKYETVRTYTYTYNLLCEFLGRKDFSVGELTVGIVKDFAYSLERSLKTNTIKRVMGCIASVWNYAIARKLVSGDDYPFNVFQYSQRYRETARDYHLEKSHIIRLRDYFLNLVIERNGKLWHYKDGAYERLHKRYTKEFAVCWFLMSFKMNGLSPIDFAVIKPGDCKRIVIGGEEYWSIDIKRKKTSRDVHIRLKRDLLTLVGFEGFLAVSGHFVYPIIHYHDGHTDTQMLNQCHKASRKAILRLREALNEINLDIARDNADNHVSEPLIDSERVVMYTQRHSFATEFLNTPGASINGLASLLGRSPNTIATYVKQITRDEDIAEMMEYMPI